MSETNLVTALIEFLQYAGWLVLRINSGARKVEDAGGNERFFWFSKWFILGDDPQTAGVSDLIALHPAFRPLAIEAKLPGNKPSPAQKRFLAAWAEHGGAWCVCESLDDLIVALDGMVRELARDEG